MTILLTYEGYALMERENGGGYFSVIDGKNLTFDTACQWVQYINLIKKNK